MNTLETEMPEPWTIHHEKQFIKRLKPHLLPGYRAGLELRWYGMSEDRGLMSLDERIELLSAVGLRMELVHWRGKNGSLAHVNP